METPAQRERRIQQLESGRAQRHSAQTPLSPPGAVEIAPGRGDLRYSSWQPFLPYSVSLIAGKVASYADLFCTQPWVASAVMRMLTWSVRVPLKVYRSTGPENSRLRLRSGDHPLATAIADPWPGGFPAALTQNLLGPLLVHGNSVTELELGRGGDISGFIPHDWRFCRPIMPWRDSLEGYEFDVDTPETHRAVSADRVLHPKWWSPVGPLGTSPLQQLGVTLSIEDAAQRYQQALFRNGARPPSAIEASEEFLGLDPVERQAIMAQLREDVTVLYAGPENGGRPALLPPGLQWKPVGHSAVEAALIDQRRITREEVAGVYLVPPPMLGILDKATYSNIDTQKEMIYTDCLGPPLVLLEQLLNAVVLRDQMQESDVYCQYDFGAVLRGSALEEIQAIREAIGSAILTPNEGRDLRNMPRSDEDGMDDFYLPTNNLQPVGSPPMAAFGQPPPGPGTPPRPDREPPRRPSRKGARIYVRERFDSYDYDPMETAR